MSRMLLTSAARRAPALAPPRAVSLSRLALPASSSAISRRGLASWDNDWEEGTSGRRRGRAVAPRRQRRQLPAMRQLVTSPFDRLMEAFENDISNLFPERDVATLVEGDQWGRELSEWAPKVNISETKDSIHVHAELPGVKKEEVQVEVDDDGYLVIKGDKKQESKEEDKERHYVRVESSFGHFERRIPLPEGVSGDQIKAKYNDGVLEVDIPRPATRERSTTPINVE